MRIKLLILSLCLAASSAFGQFKLKQIEPCKDNAGNRLDSCFVMTDALGMQYYITIDQLIGIVSGMSGFDCDSVAACLVSGGTLCNALGNFPIGIPTVNDYLIARNGTNCKRIALDSVVSSTNICSKLGFPITSVSNSDYFLIKKANGDCRRVLASNVVGKVNCDSVEACLSNGSLCDVLRGFTNGTPASGDSIIFIKNGTCRKGSITTLIGGGFSCDSIKACIGNGTWFCDSVQACLVDGSLCTALRSFTSGTFQAGDSIWFSHNGVCRRGLIDDLIGGGGGSLNCDSVKSCLSNGALCDAVGDLDVDGGGSEWYVLGRNGDGDCARIPWDSVNQACTMEVEVGAFGGGPEGCCFATSCDGGNTHSNLHWVFPALSGSNLQIKGGSEGGQECLMGEVTLPFVDSIWVTKSCSDNKINYKKDGSTFTTDLPKYTLEAVNFGGNSVKIRIKQDGTQCSEVCLTGTGLQICGAPLVGQTDKVATPSTDYPTIDRVDITKLKRYKSHVAADNDKTLPHGGLYLVGNYRSIQIKP